MVTKTIYVCELCDREFETEEEALNCEAIHEKGLEIESVNYRSTDIDKFPHEITVIAESGNKMTYFRPIKAH